MINTADVTGGKPITVLLQSISGVSAINPLVAFTTSTEERERCYSFILSRTPHENELFRVRLCHFYSLKTTFSNILKRIILIHVLKEGDNALSP
jgi:hypothetical protein